MSDQELSAQVAELERQVAELRLQMGFVCVQCRNRIPATELWYEARRKGCGAPGSVFPLCSHCATTLAYTLREFQISGPMAQPVARK